MEELLFKKGQLANLPTERQSGTFYVTEDAKTIYIDNMVIQDTEDVKEELIGIIVDNELVTAEGLTYLYDNKADITALEALGDRIPVKTSQLTNDSGYITANEIPEMDLDGYSKTGHTHDDLYYTETEINTKLNGKQDTISDLGTIISGAALGATALQSVPEEYATKTYVGEEVSKLVGSAPETLNTLEELAQALDNNADIVSVLNDAIANKANIDDLSAYTTNALHEELKAEVEENEYVAAQALTKLDSEKANKSDIPTSLSQLTNDSGFITASEVPSQDLSGYVTTEALEAKGYLTEIPSDYVTETELTNKGYLTEIPSDYVTETELANKGYLTSVPSEYVTEDMLSGYTSTEKFDELYNGVIDNELVISKALIQLDADKANVSDIPTNISELNNDKGYITIADIPQQDLTDYALKTEIPTKVSSLENDSNFITQEAIDTLQNSIDSLVDEVEENEYVSAQALTKLENEKANKSDIPTSLSQLTNDSGFITASEVPNQDLSGYVTTEALEAKGYLTSVPSEYVTETELTNKGYLTSVPAEYITETELANKNYATSSYVIGELAKKSDTGHTHSEYVTETELTSKNFTTVSDVENKINALDATISGNSSHVTVKITEENGKLSSLNVTESNIASANDLESVSNTVTTIQTSVGELEASVGENTAAKTLSERLSILEDGYDAPDARANVLWIGTSIPAGDIQFSNNGTTQSTTTDLGSNNYPKMVADVLGFNLYNNSRGSSFVCFYPPNEDGTANWASASDWVEYSSEVWKGYSLSASFAQVDEKFGPNGLNCPQWLINNFKSYSYESLIIPYIDGTLASCDTVVIDHGYNDRNVIINEASWHPSEGETQFAAGAGRDWLLKLQDPFETTLETETYFQGKWHNDESVSSKKHYISAIIFLVKKIWAVNPKIKIIIGNYFTSKSTVFGSEFGNDRLGEFVHLANSAIASWLRVNCVEVWHHTGIYNRTVGGVNDYANFCPDGVHPHSDSSGRSNEIIAGVYINSIKGTLYKK